MKSILQTLILLACSCFCQTFILAQTPTPTEAKYARIKLKEGGELIVRLIEKNESIVTVLDLTTDKIVKISTAEMAWIEPFIPRMNQYGRLDKSQHPAYTSRNFLSNTSLGLKRGENYYQNIMVGYNAAFFGVTNHFSIGVGTELFSLLSGEGFGLFAMPKIRYSINDYVHFSGNGLLLVQSSFDDIVTTQALWGSLTLGNIQNNLTLNLGRFGNPDDGLNLNVPIWSASTKLSISKRFKFMMDFWQLGSNNNRINDFDAQQIINTAFRIQGRRVGFDFGVLLLRETFRFNTVTSVNVIPIPILGLIIPFGRS
jgi:hypothetical protein